MPLDPGTQIGPYEIRAAIGSGGMGVVYRASDTKLGRDVALKFLPEQFALDPERMARFQREARVLASLNHPNIAAIYGLEEPGSVRALVMELVEGSTLAERIAAVPMPIEEVLPIAKQIADAVEYAHERGVIHRDLKPANIKITREGQVKVLDFGLAKALERDPLQSDGWREGLSNSPTLSLEATQAGVLLGTAAYMSPEQAKGKAVDRRADIWAFGVVVYEMLTGRMMFTGETASETMAQVLLKDPDWSVLPASTPLRLRSLLRRCLMREPQRRLQAIGDARLEIEEIQGEPLGSTEPRASMLMKPSRRREMVWVLTTLVFLMTTMGIGFRHVFEPVTQSPGRIEFEVLAPEGATFGGVSKMSPDGNKLAFVATSDSKTMIWVRPLDSSTAQALPSTEGTDPGSIFWSADSQYIGFSQSGKLKKVPASGGPSQVFGNITGSAYNDGWSAEGIILHSGPGNPDQRLFRVPASGGQPALETELDAARKENSHRGPSFLPDNRHYFFLAVSSDPQNNQAYIGTLGSKERRPLPGIASTVQYSSGHVFFVREGALMAQPFDVNRLELAGDPFTIADPFVLPSNVGGPFSVSITGSLAYRVDVARGDSQLVWFDRTGKQLAIAGPKGQYVDIELSPDGKHVVFSRGSPSDIWTLEFGRDRATRFTLAGAQDANPVWSPDGRTIAFRRRDGGNIYQRAFGVVAEDKPLMKNEGVKLPSDWSENYLVYRSGNDIWALPLPASGDPKPLSVTQSPFDERFGTVSPDGHWIAYQSNESGSQNDVYIQAFPQPGSKQPVSTAGGVAPKWSRDGKELFYVAPDFTMMAASIKPSGSTLEVGAPVPLFRVRLRNLTNGNNDVTNRNYDVAPDGRFLLNVASEEQTSTPITVILNWASGLKK